MSSATRMMTLLGQSLSMYRCCYSCYSMTNMMRRPRPYDNLFDSSIHSHNNIMIDYNHYCLLSMMNYYDVVDTDDFVVVFVAVDELLLDQW